MAEAAKAYPETYSFDGYDISSDQFLHASALPSNASLGIANFKKPFPAEMHGKYDLLTMRLLGITMGMDVWVSTLQNILTLLKPGGAIEWVKGNFLEGTRGLRGTAPRSTPGHALTRMQNQFMLELAVLSGYNFPDFMALFTDGGLADVEEDVVSTDRIVELRGDFTEVRMGASLNGLRNLARLKTQYPEFWSKAKVEEASARAREEIESGAYLRSDLHIAIGFKKGQE